MSTSEFVFTRKMGIGGIVLEDKEERDVIFRIPLGERRRTSIAGGGVDGEFDGNDVTDGDAMGRVFTRRLRTARV